jgi:hypothetical protein
VMNAAIFLVAFIIGCWIAYHVLKAAIRDGIRESGLRTWWEPTMPKEHEKPRAPAGYRWELMREERRPKP